MKTIAMLISGIFLFTFCQYTGKKNTGTKMLKNDFEKYRLHGALLSYEETPYKTDSLANIVEMDSCCITFHTFDETGFMVNRRSSNSEGAIIEELIFEHFDNGLWKGVWWKEGESVGSEMATLNDTGEYASIFEYDSAGNKVSYFSDVTLDADGQMLSWKQYGMDSTLRMAEEARYDNSLLISKVLRDGTGKLIFEMHYRYNDRGEPFEVSNSRPHIDTITTSITKYTYEMHDEMGNWTHRTKWNNEGKIVGISKRHYTYRKDER